MGFRKCGIFVSNIIFGTHCKFTKSCGVIERGYERGYDLNYKNLVESRGKCISCGKESLLGNRLCQECWDNEKSQRLTKGEDKVLSLLCDGFNNEAIAGKLCLEVKTIEHHLNSLYRKANIPRYANKRVWIVLHRRGLV